MAKTPNTTPETPATETKLDLNQQVSLTGADLLNLFSVMQSQNAKTLAEALEKLSPHYKSPEQKQNEQTLQQSSHDMEIYKLKLKRRQQRLCEHEQGQTGNERNGRGAFNLLKLPTGEVIGVCTYCQMVISSTNPDHHKFFRKNGGTMAEAGQFALNDPIKAQLARLSPDERNRILEKRSMFVSANTNTDDILDEEI